MNVNVRVGARRIGVVKERPMFARIFITCANACALIPRIVSVQSGGN